MRYKLEKSLHGGDRKSSHHYDDLKTKDKIAIEESVGSATVERAEKYVDALEAIAGHSDELKNKILGGDRTFTKKNTIQLGAIVRDEPEIGEAAVDELIAGNAKTPEQAISIARKNDNLQKQSKLAADIVINGDYKHGDCLDILPSLDNDSVRLLLTDPPYGINYRSNHHYASAPAPKITNDDLGALDLFYDMLGKIHYAMQIDCHLLVFTTWRVEHDFMQVLSKFEYDVRGSLVWVKENHTSGNLGAFAPKHERIIHATRGNAKIKPRVADVLRFNRSYKTGHPTEKPVDLLKELINCTTSVGDLVVDPFAGTGATVVAAKSINRHVLGIELEEQWYNIGKIRLK
jgi:site-specific DNA-methyltransferase (adenine-specific)